jgi:hypothetical protein
VIRRNEGQGEKRYTFEDQSDFVVVGISSLDSQPMGHPTSHMSDLSDLLISLRVVADPLDDVEYAGVGVEDGVDEVKVVELEEAGQGLHVHPAVGPRLERDHSDRAEARQLRLQVDGRRRP